MNTVCIRPTYFMPTIKDLYPSHNDPETIIPGRHEMIYNFIASANFKSKEINKILYRQNQQFQKEGWLIKRFQNKNHHQSDSKVTTFIESGIRITHQIIETDEWFKKCCRSNDFMFSPKKLKFIPSSVWNDRQHIFSELVLYFQCKSSTLKTRFVFKLFNALQLTKSMPELVPIIGVEWITEDIICVTSKAFARLLGISCVDGSLYHVQGNFPTHGFIEITKQEAIQHLSDDILKNIDFDIMRLFVHKNGMFKKTTSGSDIESLVKKHSIFKKKDKLYIIN